MPCSACRPRRPSLLFCPLALTSLVASFAAACACSLYEHSRFIAHTNECRCFPSAFLNPPPLAPCTDFKASPPPAPLCVPSPACNPPPSCTLPEGALGLSSFAKPHASRHSQHVMTHKSLPCCLPGFSQAVHCPCSPPCVSAAAATLTGRKAWAGGHQGMHLVEMKQSCRMICRC